jgi:hypothetical protein
LSPVFRGRRWGSYPGGRGNLAVQRPQRAGDGAGVTTYSQYAIRTNVNDIKGIEAQTLAGISAQKIFFQPDVNVDLAIAQIVSATDSIRALSASSITSPPAFAQTHQPNRNS